MSREALSLDISRVVALVVGGEAIDTTAKGQVLAEKYPDLGMSAEMIGQAIQRAAGMVGMIRSAPEPVVPRRREPAPLAAPAPVDKIGEIARPAERSVGILPAAPTIDDDLAAAIDAEIGNLVTASRAAAPAAAPPAPAPEPRPVPFRPFEPFEPFGSGDSKAFTPRPPAGSAPRGATFERGGPARMAEAERSAFSRVRRAFFRN